MAEPELKLLQTMVQRLLDEHKSLREYLDVQFALIRNRDFRIEGHDGELRAVETMLAGHERRIATLESKTPAE